MCTTSPIAAAGAIVGSRPGAGSSTMPRMTLSLRVWALASGASTDALNTMASTETAVAKRAGSRRRVGWRVRFIGRLRTKGSKA